MANNYLLFSQSLKVETDEQKTWLEQWVSPYRKDMTEEELQKWAEERGIEPDDADLWPNFQYSFEGSKPTEKLAKRNENPNDKVISYKSIETAPWEMWIYAEESGSPSLVAAMVQAYFKRFKINSVFILTWAETCSKPRIGEFSGGGFIVTPFGKKVLWSTPEMLFDKVCTRLEKAAEKSKKGKKGKKAKKWR